MKYLIATLTTTFVVLTFAAPAVAAEDGKDILCPTMGKLAESIMKTRQSGATMADMRAVALKQDAPIDKITLTLVGEAFDRPYMEAPENKQRYIRQFREDVEVMCYSL